MACRRSASKLTTHDSNGAQHSHLALIPLVILWFGIDECKGCFWSRSGVSPDLSNTAARQSARVDPQLIERTGSTA